MNDNQELRIKNKYTQEELVEVLDLCLNKAKELMGVI